MKIPFIFLITYLISSSFEIRTKMEKKILKTKQTYADTITVEGVAFQDNCIAFEEGYSFILQISQTSLNYPLLINEKINIVEETDSSVSIPCTCISNKGASYLNCTLDKNLASTNYNNKNFRVQKTNDLKFDCTASGSIESETCLLKAFDYDDTITYHNLYDVVSNEQNNTYVIDYGVRTKGDIYVKFDTFVIGEGPQITLDGTEINKCEEIPYDDNEDEGQFMKCTVSKEQFDVDGYKSYPVIVINQCGYEEYPGINVIIMNSNQNHSFRLKVTFSFLILVLAFIF